MPLFLVGTGFSATCVTENARNLARIGHYELRHRHLCHDDSAGVVRRDIEPASQLVHPRQKTISITATQHRTARVCPLIPSLADAIARYIREVRPQTDYREIFLRLNAPRRPFRHGGLWGIVATRFKRLGIKSTRKGPHSLRHACATHLLSQGLTLTEVGGHLGHRSLDSTRVYAKVDMPALREVANLDLGGKPDCRTGFGPR